VRLRVVALFSSAAPHPKFGKLLTCNFFPGRNQKLQLNIYSAPWKDNMVDNSIKDEDRIGSVIIALDKVVPVNALSRESFAPVSCELPMWHDGDDSLNDRLAAAGANMKVAFKASENQPEQFFAGSGPQADQNIHQALAMMIAGGEFLKYPFGSSGAPQKRFVWYDKNDGPMGTLYWSEAQAHAHNTRSTADSVQVQHKEQMLFTNVTVSNSVLLFSDCS